MRGPSCQVPECTEAVACCGRYECHGPVAYSCDTHCGHGNEDGWCKPVCRVCGGTECNCGTVATVADGPPVTLGGLARDLGRVHADALSEPSVMADALRASIAKAVSSMIAETKGEGVKLTPENARKLAARLSAGSSPFLAAPGIRFTVDEDQPDPTAIRFTVQAPQDVAEAMGWCSECNWIPCGCDAEVKS